MDTIKLPYDDLITTKINGKRHYLTPQGNSYPSVTTFLGLTKDEEAANSLNDWRERVGDEEADRITNGAAKRGSAIHDMIEQYLLSNPKWQGDYWEGYVEVVDNMMDKLNRITKVHHLEAALYSDQLKLAGRVDCIGEFDGEIAIIDFKNSLKPKRKEWIEDYWLQTTLYSLMVEDLTGIKISKLVIIVGVDDETSQLFICRRERYYKKLLERLKVFRNQLDI